MTDTCKCPPDDCHGGHTINVGPARLTDEQLRHFAEPARARFIDTAASISSMAAELLALRARVAELEAEAQADEHAIEEARDERDAARALAEDLGQRCDELLAKRNPDDEVLVEGSWFHPGDLPKILGNHMRSLTEELRRTKDALIALEAARARITELEAEGDGWQELSAKWNARFAQLSNQSAELDRRGRELEAAQREPIGYAVVSTADQDDYLCLASEQPWERPECRCPDCRADYDPYADEETDDGE